MEIKPALDSYLWTQLSQNNSAMAYEDVVVVYRQNRSIRVISYRSEVCFEATTIYVSLSLIARLCRSESQVRLTLIAFYLSLSSLLISVFYF